MPFGPSRLSVSNAQPFLTLVQPEVLLALLSHARGGCPRLDQIEWVLWSKRQPPERAFGITCSQERDPAHILSARVMRISAAYWSSFAVTIALGIAAAGINTAGSVTALRQSCGAIGP